MSSELNIEDRALGNSMKMKGSAPCRGDAQSTKRKLIDQVVYHPERTSQRLQDGAILSRSDLPPVDTRRWVASNKAAVVRVFLLGMISKDEVLARYELSEDEFESWLRRYLRGGSNLLKINALKK